LNLLIVGSVAFDSIESPGGRVDRALGGSAVYASLAASYQVPVRLVGVVGEDFEDSHRAVLLDRGVDIEGLESVKGGKTFFWRGVYGADPNDRKTIVTELNVFEDFSPVIPEKWRSSEWVFLANIDPDLQLKILDQCEGKPYVGCDTMNFWIEGKPDSLAKVLGRTDLFFLNDSEARQLSGEPNIFLAAKAILEMGPRIVVVKKGEHGAILMTEETLFIAPAYPLERFPDPTGAGDTFAGGFLGCLAQSGEINKINLRRAMIYGTVLASFACEGFSVDCIRNLDIDIIKERFNRLVELGRIDREV